MMGEYMFFSIKVIWNVLIFTRIVKIINALSPHCCVENERAKQHQQIWHFTLCLAFPCSQHTWTHSLYAHSRTNTHFFSLSPHTHTHTHTLIHIHTNTHTHTHTYTHIHAHTVSISNIQYVSLTQTISCKHTHLQTHLHTHTHTHTLIFVFRGLRADSLTSSN